MKHYSLLAAWILVFGTITTAISQHSSNTELPQPVRTRTYELGITGLGCHYINIMPEKHLNAFMCTQSRGILFKRSLNDKFILRAGLENERFFINHSGTQYYEVADSMNIAGNYSGNKIIAGVERRWQISNNFFVNGGADIEAAQYLYNGATQHPKTIYRHNENAVYTTAAVSPFIGIQYTFLQKFNVGAEVSYSATFIHRNSYINVTKPEPFEYRRINNSVDVNPNPIRRVFVTYSF